MRRGRASAAAALLLIAGLSGVANVGSAGFAQDYSIVGKPWPVEWPSERAGNTRDGLSQMPYISRKLMKDKE